MTEKELNIELQELQAESVNNGGIWGFSMSALDRNIRVIELYQTISGEVKITSVDTYEKGEIINIIYTRMGNLLISRKNLLNISYCKNNPYLIY